MVDPTEDEMSNQATGYAPAIAKTPGVGPLFMGPYDMSVVLGLPPGDNDGLAGFDDALTRIVAVARGAGMGAAVLSNAGLYARRASQGFNMISITTDLPALAMLAMRDLASVRGD